jgi:hypothetical protein
MSIQALTRSANLPIDIQNGKMSPNGAKQTLRILGTLIGLTVVPLTLRIVPDVISGNVGGYAYFGTALMLYSLYIVWATWFKLDPDLIKHTLVVALFWAFCFAAKFISLIPFIEGFKYTGLLLIILIVWFYRRASAYLRIRISCAEDGSPHPALSPTTP